MSLTTLERARATGVSWSSYENDDRVSHELLFRSWWSRYPDWRVESKQFPLSHNSVPLLCLPVNDCTYHTQLPILSMPTTDDRCRLRERFQRRGEEEDQVVEVASVYLFSSAMTAVSQEKEGSGSQEQTLRSSWCYRGANFHRHILIPLNKASNFIYSCRVPYNFRHAFLFWRRMYPRHDPLTWKSSTNRLVRVVVS